MRKFLAASFVLGVCFLLLVNTSGQQSEQELRVLVPKIVASWETFDLAKIEPYYAADADLTYYDLTPPEVQQLGRVSCYRPESFVRA